MNLLYRHSNPISLTKQTISFILRVMEFDVIIFAFGNLITTLVLRMKQPPAIDSHSIFYKVIPLSYIGLAITALIVAIVYKLIIELLGKFFKPYYSNEKSYS